MFNKTKIFFGNTSFKGMQFKLCQNILDFSYLAYFFLKNNNFFTLCQNLKLSLWYFNVSLPQHIFKSNPKCLSKPSLPHSSFLHISQQSVKLYDIICNGKTLILYYAKTISITKNF